MNVYDLWRRTTTPADRWVALLAGLAVFGLGWSLSQKSGGRVMVHRDNRLVLSLPLNEDRSVKVVGKLGVVTIQVKQGRVRLLEYASAKLVGTRTGWIQNVGQIAACVPCGIVLQVDGGGRPAGPNNLESQYDGIAR